MKLISPIRGWLLLAFLFTAASLALFNARVQKAMPSPVGPSFILPSDSARQLSPRVRRDAPNQAVFDIPFTALEMERAGQCRIYIKPRKDLPRCTIQVIAEGDHHFSFSHLYRLARLTGEGFAFTVPLLNDEMYWKTVGHTGPWTPWERSGLRRLEIKLFSSAPLTAADLELRFRIDPAPVADPSLAWSSLSTNSLALGQRLELAFDLSGWNGNPYAYSPFPAALEVTEPDGKSRRLLPFLHQDFTAVNRLDGERIRPGGPKHFLARYRPRMTGPHTYRLLLNGGGGPRLLREGRFDVTPGDPPGFLRVSARAPHFFERTDGRFVYLLGWNLPYPVDRPYGFDYVPYLPPASSLILNRKMLDDVADAGGNFIRFWLSDWWNGLEWDRNTDQYGGLGRYNLKNAWLNDRLVEHCEKRGIYMQWETLNHVRLSHSYGWPLHPYNRANGGFLDDPYEFWSNPETRKWSENRLSYIIARYADSPAIQSWNLMSEPDLISREAWPAAKPFILSQMDFVSRLDPYGHITSSHMCLPDHDVPFFKQERLQFVNANAYPGLGGLSGDQIPAVRDFATRYEAHGKPMIIAECAGHWGGDPAFKMRRDTLGALWAGIASNLAGAPLSWWWNFNYGEDLGRLYRVAADFMQGEDLVEADAAAGGGWLNRPVQADSRAGNARALMVGNRTRRFLFLYNFDTLSRTREIPSLCSQNRIVVGGLEPGAYQAEYWDLRQGKTEIRQDVTADSGGTALLAPPDFTEGWAVKLAPRSATPSGPVAIAALAPGAAGTNPVPGSAADWSWRLEPLVGVVNSPAAARSLVEVRLALPDACRGLYPRVANAAGEAVPFAWQALGGGSGWQLRIPAAGAGGPLRVTAVSEPAGSLALDENALGLGLTVATGGSSWLASYEQFERHFLRLAGKRETRVGCVDQLENPLGDNSDFLAVYQGPLLVPEDGSYDFACNSDDASFVRVDGREVASWPGQHDMEVRDRPNANRWRHRGRITLEKGMHTIEFNHQQRTGGCLARLGWRPPRGTRGVDAVLAVPFGGERESGFDVTPAWALDGRIPCRVGVEFQGRPRLWLNPCFGLELRRPATPLYAVALGEGEARDFRYFLKEGHHVIDAGGRSIPIWAWNAHWRRFSLEWESFVDAQRQPALKVMLFDIDMPLSVQAEGGPSVEKQVTRLTWTAWPPASAEGSASFVIRAFGIPLVRGRVEGAKP